MGFRKYRGLDKRVSRAEGFYEGVMKVLQKVSSFLMRDSIRGVWVGSMQT